MEYAILLREIRPGKIIDVSQLKSRLVNWPASSRSQFRQVENLPIVSDNYEAYAYVMDQLGPSYRWYAEEYFRLYGLGTNYAYRVHRRSNQREDHEGAPAKLAADIFFFIEGVYSAYNGYKNHASLCRFVNPDTNPNPPNTHIHVSLEMFY